MANRISELRDEFYNDLKENEHGDLLRTLDEIEGTLSNADPRIFGTGKGMANACKGLMRRANVIPSSSIGECNCVLYVYAGLYDNLNDRLREGAIHAFIDCHGINQKLVFITTNWDGSSWVGHFEKIFQGIHRCTELVFIRVMVDTDGSIFSRKRLI